MLPNTNNYSDNLIYTEKLQMASIIFKFPDQREFTLLIKQLDEVRDTTPIMARLAGMLEGYIDENFEQEGRPTKWKPLSKEYEAQKTTLYGKASILQTTEDLASSVQPSYGRDYAQVSTNLVYAAIHHFGGTIKPKNKGALAFGFGGKKIVRKSVTIPARPFMTITDEDKAEIRTEIQDFIARKLGLQRR
jgi:phage virion morphogenesis protein